MSPAIGPVSVLPPPGQEAPFGQDGAAPATKQLVDEEVRRIVDDCYPEALATLREHLEQLDRLANTLLQREILDEDEAYAAAGIRRENAPAAIARDEAPGAQPAPGLPPEDAPVDAQDGLRCAPATTADRPGASKRRRLYSLVEGE